MLSRRATSERSSAESAENGRVRARNSTTSCKSSLFIVHPLPGRLVCSCNLPWLRRFFPVFGGDPAVMPSARNNGPLSCVFYPSRQGKGMSFTTSITAGAPRYVCRALGLLALGFMAGPVLAGTLKIST
ncbi:unnamed protein product, partial [Laminaria digitata]